MYGVELKQNGVISGIQNSDTHKHKKEKKKTHNSNLEVKKYNVFYTLIIKI